MTHHKKVVLTGNFGLITGLMLPALRERYDLTLLDNIRTTDRDGNEVEGIQENMRSVSLRPLRTLLTTLTV